MLAKAVFTHGPAACVRDSEENGRVNIRRKEMSLSFSHFM
jgi:hypothetical protein